MYTDIYVIHIWEQKRTLSTYWQHIDSVVSPIKTYYIQEYSWYKEVL